MEMLDIKRGDIVLINTKYDVDTKTLISSPFLVVQNNIGNKYLSTVIAIPIISSFDKAKVPTRVELPREVTGLDNNSIAITERITTHSKKSLKFKIGEINTNSEHMRKIERAILTSIGDLIPKGDELKYSFGNITKDYSSYIMELTKPLVITEGKTDVVLIETAWKKLYPNKEMFFKCEASGIESELEIREGGAECVRRTVEFLANVTDRPIIGLFDNDREGNEKFNGANNKIFEKSDIRKSVRKHLTKNVWVMLLPVPSGRELFVTEDDIEQRYFVIEHYFSDDILKRFEMYGRNVLKTSVFKINGGKKKNNFSNKVKELDVEDFINFKVLFEEIEKVFASQNKD